jgi:hypothetical protein
MPSWRNKPADRQYLNKRYTPKQQQALFNAAMAATQRLYCDVLSFWRACANKQCRRHLRCTGDQAACLRRGWRTVSKRRQRWAYAQVLAGGPRRLSPANHKEWGVRRDPPSSIVG